MEEDFEEFQTSNSKLSKDITDDINNSLVDQFNLICSILEE